MLPTFQHEMQLQQELACQTGRGAVAECFSGVPKSVRPTFWDYAISAAFHSAADSSV